LVISALIVLVSIPSSYEYWIHGSIKIILIIELIYHNFVIFHLILYHKYISSYHTHTINHITNHEYLITNHKYLIFHLSPFISFIYHQNIFIINHKNISSIFHLIIHHSSFHLAYFMKIISMCHKISHLIFHLSSCTIKIFHLIYVSYFILSMFRLSFIHVSSFILSMFHLIHVSSFFHLSSFIFHLSSFIFHLSSFIFHLIHV